MQFKKEIRRIIQAKNDVNESAADFLESGKNHIALKSFYAGLADFEKQIELAQKQLVGARKAGAGITVAQDLMVPVLAKFDVLLRRAQDFRAAAKKELEI
jgi:hypothetical protein